MFFPERIKNVRRNSKILEVGPGFTPFYRSNVLLEKVFEQETYAIEQAGGVDRVNLKKRIVFYQGDRFPFDNSEFDYVICSHVLEHIPENDLPQFISELERVAPSGYIEVPLFRLELLSEIRTHQSILFVDNKRALHFLFKDKLDFNNSMFKALVLLLKEIDAKDTIVQRRLELFASGFEYTSKIDYLVHSSYESFMKVVTTDVSQLGAKKGNNLSCLKNAIRFFQPNIFKQKVYNRFKIVL